MAMIAKVKNPYILDNFQELPWLYKIWFAHLFMNYQDMLVRWSNMVLKNRESIRLRAAIEKFNNSDIIIIDNDEAYENRSYIRNK